MALLERWFPACSLAILLSCGSSGSTRDTSDDGALPEDGGPPGSPPPGGALVTIPPDVSAVQATGHAGDVRGEGNYSYEVMLDLSSNPYTIQSTFSQGGASCSGKRSLDASEMASFDALVASLTVAARSSKGTEFCLSQEITLVPKTGDPIGMTTLNNGCGNAPYILCNRRDDFYALLENLVAVDDPATCPPEHLRLLHRVPPPEDPPPPAKCSGTTR